MKKLFILALCAMAVMQGCKNKGQVSDAEAVPDSLLTDTIAEAIDTIPKPMFLMENSEEAMVLYWMPAEAPQKGPDGEDEYYISAYHSWAKQEQLRRNRALYTNLVTRDGIVKVKFVREVLKDPDGNFATLSEIHGRKGIPAQGAVFEAVDAKDQKRVVEYGGILVTDEYLQARKLLPVKAIDYSDDHPKSLPAAAIKQLEQKYGMKVERSAHLYTIGDNYIFGSLQFKGEYKNAPKNKYNPDVRSCLALDVLVVGDSVVINEQVGYYESETDKGWNVDDEGIYLPSDIIAAFEGPKGLELCYSHGAPESITIGMLYQLDSQLVEDMYECYHVMVDEQEPVWKSEIEQMRKLYKDLSPDNSDVKLTKMARTYVDYDGDWIWLRDESGNNGALFVRLNGEIRLVAEETPKLKFSRAMNNGKAYLIVSGSAGGPSYYCEIHVFKDGKEVETFNALQVYDEIDECQLNGKTISKEEGKAYLEKIPAGEQLQGYFDDIKDEKQ